MKAEIITTQELKERYQLSDKDKEFFDSDQFTIILYPDTKTEETFLKQRYKYNKDEERIFIDIFGLTPIVISTDLKEIEEITIPAKNKTAIDYDETEPTLFDKKEQHYG